MSRTFPNTVLKRSLAAESAMPVQFIRFAFGGGDIRVTTAPFDIDWDGFTWQGIGGQLTIEAIRETPDDRGGQMTLRLSGVDQSMLSAILAEAYIGRVVEIWLGWVAQGTNLCPNSGVETNADNFVGVNSATVAREVGGVGTVPVAYEGEAVLKVTIADLVTDSAVVWIAGSGPTFFPVIPGQTYGAVCALARPVATSSVGSLRFRLGWYDSGDAAISSTDATITIQPGGGWVRAEVSGVAPSNADHAKVFVGPAAAAPTFVFYQDAAQFGPGSQLYQPTDGAAIIGGTILDRPLGPMSFFMNGGFEVTESPGDREGGTVDVEGRVVSRLASLLQPRGFRTNRESHQTVYRTDQFFEFVPGLAGREVTWGWTKKLLIASFNKRIRRWFD